MNILPLRIDQYKVISLTHNISSNIPIWPGDPPFESCPVASLKEDSYFLRAFRMGEHSGTHVNAPRSFFESESDNWVKPRLLKTVVIDVNDDARSSKNAVYNKNHLKKFELEQGEIPAKCFVIFRTGWDKYWQNPNKFLGLNAKKELHFPSISLAVIKTLIKERHVSGIGVDTHGLDAPDDSTYSNNKLVLSNGGIVVECLANLKQLPCWGSWCLIAPLPLVNGSGSPAIVSALIPISHSKIPSDKLKRS